MTINIHYALTVLTRETKPMHAPYLEAVKEDLINTKYKLEQLQLKLSRLEDDSLDAIIECCGSGEEFAQYNKGKSFMRDWFLKRIKDM